MKRTLGGIFLLVLVFNSANAALLSRLSGQAYYDTVLNITWVADANLSRTSGYDADGLMTWSGAQTWIASLNTASYLGVTDWRLPTTARPDATCSSNQADSQGTGCTGSEMGHLFYLELGGVALQSITTTHNANYNLFSNIKTDGRSYWSGTQIPNFSTLGYYFAFANGFQNY